MQLSEPATMVTDYVLALACAFFAYSLHRSSKSGSVRLWVAAFSVTALAALAGGTAHGFRIPLGDNWRPVWNVTLVSIVAGSALLIAAGARSVLHPEAKDENSRREGSRWLKRAVAVSLTGLTVLVLKLAPHRDFNHNDLYHGIQTAGLYCLYRGARRFHGLNGSDR